jgi:hypothetical protein
MTVYTVSSEAQTSKVCPDACIPAGVVLSRTGTYTAVANMEANSIIHLIPMPKGAQLLDLLVAWTALGAGRTLDVGIADTGYTGSDVDMFFIGLVAQHAGYARFGAAMIDGAADGAAHGAQMLADTWPYEFTANGSIDVTVLGNTFPTGKTITAVAIYKMEGAIDDET